MMMTRLHWPTEVGSSTTLALFVPGTPVNNPGNKRNDDQKQDSEKIWSKHSFAHKQNAVLSCPLIVDKKEHLMEEIHGLLQLVHQPEWKGRLNSGE